MTRRPTPEPKDPDYPVPARAEYPSRATTGFFVLAAAALAPPPTVSFYP